MTEQTTPTVPPHPYAGATDGAGGGDEGALFTRLRDGLPDDLKTHPSLASYGDFEGMARSLVAAQTMVGKRISEASREELASIDRRHGRPETADGYQLLLDAGVPADEAGETMTALAREWFFEAGLTQRQAEILGEKWQGLVRDDLRERSHQRGEAESVLRAEWGRDYEPRVSAASGALRAFGGDDLARLVEETGLGNDPRMIRAFARIAEATGEESMVEGHSSGFENDPSRAREDIAKLMTHPAYFDSRHGEHDDVVSRMRRLFSAAYPQAPK